MDERTVLLADLTERLPGREDGKPKVFRESAVGNPVEFFRRFRQLNVRSNQQLDELVAQCEQIVQGVEPQPLRESNPLRQTVASGLDQVQNVLDSLRMDRPRRNILRRPR